MILNRLTPVQRFEIFQPRWHDRKVLLAKYKVGTHNMIVFTKTPSMEGEYYVSGKVVMACPVETNGKLACYAVPMNDLEPLERE